MRPMRAAGGRRGSGAARLTVHFYLYDGGSAAAPLATLPATLRFRCWRADVDGFPPRGCPDDHEPILVAIRETPRLRSPRVYRDLDRRMKVACFIA